MTVDRGGVSNCPSATARAALKTNETGWSFDKSVVRFPRGMVPVAIVMGVEGLITFPSAMVPSWQDRHKTEEPFG